MRKIKACILVYPDDRAKLGKLAADRNTAQKIVMRAKIVLASGRGLGTNAIMAETGASKPTVWRWQEAWLEGGIERLRKDKGKGPLAGKPPISDAVRLAIVTRSTLPNFMAVLTPNSPSWRKEAPCSERLVFPSSTVLIMSSSSPS